MIRAAYPGSFDPPTYGHLDILERAGGLFDEILVVVGVNSTKNCLFSVDERIHLLKELCRGMNGVSVHPCTGLVVDFALQNGCSFLIRGLRNAADFSYEYDISVLNRGIGRNIETLFMAADPKHCVIRSSAVKEIAMYGGDLSKLVPPVVAAALQKKLRLTGADVPKQSSD
jgi:pantetheine-phosphate adenylyltransferase